jgi:hypothetical protein
MCGETTRIRFYFVLGSIISIIDFINTPASSTSWWVSYVLIAPRLLELRVVLSPLVCALWCRYVGSSDIYVWLGSITANLDDSDTYQVSTHDNLYAGQSATCNTHR